MILSFSGAATEDVYHGRDTKEARRIPKEIWGLARRKMDRLNAAVKPMDLKDPPGNRLESLKGELKGKYSIRINNQYRIVFRFENGNASEVRIDDYH